MLQWARRSLNIVFEGFGRAHVARIVDPRGNLVETLAPPVAAISPGGSRAPSYSSLRLRRAPYAYAYANGKDPESDHLVATNHGLHLMRLPSGDAELLLAVAGIAALVPQPSIKGAFHSFAHCQFCPSGGRFSFFHRWMQKGYLCWTRMISCDLDGAISTSSLPWTWFRMLHGAMMPCVGIRKCQGVW